MSSEDTNYVGLELSPVDVTITDNSTAGITLMPVDSTTSESGETGTINVVLNTQPTADVVITLRVAIPKRAR